MSTFVYVEWVGGQCNVYVDIFSFYIPKRILQCYKSDADFEANEVVLDEFDSDVQRNPEAEQENFVEKV